MQSVELIKYKWEHGVYKLSYMVSLVYSNVISRDQFFNITGYSFDGVIKIRKF